MKAAAALALAFVTFEAQAHGFATRYDLPLPLGYFLAGAGATVALSFVLLAAMGAALRPHRGSVAAFAAIAPVGHLALHRWIAAALRGIAVALFLLVFAAAAFGDIDPFRNISTTFVWVIWWVGIMFINTFVGDLWALINPWNTIFAGAEKALHSLRRDAKLALERPYPERLGVWPAIALFLAFTWIEVVSGQGEDVRILALLIATYSLITWTGMLVYGRNTWLAHGEAFSVVLSTFARFAPIAPRTTVSERTRDCAHGIEADGFIIGCGPCFAQSSPAERALVLRPPGCGLLVSRPVSASTAALVFTLLASVTFDGFVATPAWTALYERFTGLASPALEFIFNYYVLATAVLLLFPLLFAGAFLLCCRMTAAIAGGISTREIAGNFVLTLLPIAIAYHFAHYLTYLLLTGQFIIPAVSDPFGFGWNLFGTASYKPDIALVGAKFYWYTGVIAIVTGHVIAVYLAHRTALRLFGGKRLAASQLPLLALMVGYTMTSLWIIAQPAVN